MGQFVTVARTRDVPPGTMKTVQVRRAPVVLANVEGTVYALGGWCTHRQADLVDGSLWGTLLTCPYHGGQFDVPTGAVLDGPPPRPLPTYPVRIVGDAIQIDLD